MGAPLEGVRVVELGGIGPAPFCAMVLADLGAEVVKVSRTADVHVAPNPVLDRGRRMLAVDLKRPDAVAAVRALVDRADVLVEGFRPGVAERLGFVPDELRATNPRLVVGRMTGYGQSGPLAAVAGHDINYIARTGVLHAIGRLPDRPVPPLNLVGDFGGGGMLLALGVVSAVLQARATGVGQDVDAAMVDGSSLLMAMQHGFVAQQRWSATERGVNIFDGSAPYYDTYECADGGFMAVGSIEPQFFAALVKTLGLTEQVDLTRQRHPETHPELRRLLTEAFRQRSRDDWTAAFDGVDACVSPVLSVAEAQQDAHLTARSAFVTDEAGVVHPAPAPRFSAAELRPPAAPAGFGADTDALLSELGLGADEVARLRETGAVA